MLTENENITVIMRSKNSSPVIGQAIAALFAQDFPNFDLLVVDSGSTDATLDIVREYPCTVVCIEPKSYFPGAVLNMAIERARSGIVVFQNSDTVPLVPSALSALLEPFRDPEVQAVFGRQIPRPEAHAWVRRDYAKSFPPACPAPPWITLSLPFAAMRKTAWARHPFYGDAWASEDTEWGHWARRNGLRIDYVPQAAVMHSHNYTLRQVYGRRFVEGEADAFIYGKRTSLARTLTATLMDTCKDVAHALRGADVIEALTAPARRLVCHYSYYKGHRWGESRLKSGDKNVSYGQTTVLTRHEDRPSP